MADPGCFSRILIFTHPDPGSKTVTKERDEKKFVILFFVVTNFTKLNIMLFLKCLRKKFGPICKELLKFFTKNFSICSQIYGFGIRDPRSGIRKKPIPDPGSRCQKGTGSRIRIRNTGKTEDTLNSKVEKPGIVNKLKRSQVERRSCLLYLPLKPPLPRPLPYMGRVVRAVSTSWKLDSSSSW